MRAARLNSYSLGGAPSGMMVSSAGVVSWAKPVTGSYSVTVTAKDSKTGSAVLSLTVNAS